jgi:hypothetical protein
MPHPPNVVYELLPIIILALLVLLHLVLWVVALVDVTRRRFGDSNTKLVWVLVILLAGAIGAVIYLIVGRKQGSRLDSSAASV